MSFWGATGRAVKIYSKTVDCLSSSHSSEPWRSEQIALENCRAARAVLLAHEHDHPCTAGNPEMEELVLGDQGQFGG